MLLLRHPGGRVDQLKHFYWRLRWEARFEPLVRAGKVPGIRQTDNASGNRMTFEPFADEPVTDARLAALIKAPRARTCNERSYLRNNNPEVHHHARW